MKLLILIFFFISIINLSKTSMTDLVLSKKNREANNYNEDSTLIFVKGGSFRMGNKTGEKDEIPIHKVKLSDFYIKKYEVTNADFVQFLNEKGNQYEDHSYWIDMDGKWRGLKCRVYKNDNKFFVEEGYENHPVNFVSWYGANSYCKWKGGRLPTEAEWEYASTSSATHSRGSATYSKGRNIQNLNINIDEYAWYSGNSNNEINKVGSKKPNALGIHDMQGSLWEWCSDWYDAEFYSKSKRKNPQNIGKADFKVIRGGSWANDKAMLRITNRNALNQNVNKINLGFRIVYDL
ncbi:MAG: SUMF1/EgtB/PvdO family nonheme iron enzyme [Bacteroidota bacterium]